MSNLTQGKGKTGHPPFNHQYSNGVSVKSTDVTGGVAGTVYQQITGINARGQVETETSKTGHP